MIKGIGASSGIAIGQAFVIPTWEWDIPDKMINDKELSIEFERLYQGIHLSKAELEAMKQQIMELVGENESRIFDAHLAILEDPVFMTEVQGLIERQFRGAEVAVKQVVDKFVTMFTMLEDDLMKERAVDIMDVGNRLLKHLLGLPEQNKAPQAPSILIAKELTPSRLAHLDPNHLLGIVTMMGGVNSHTAIMARALGIPMILGLDGKLSYPIQTGDELIIDGDEGILFVNPDEATMKSYDIRKSARVELKEQLNAIAKQPAVTMDGQKLQIAANISSKKELEIALQNGASGVGLFRTEFLYMDRNTFPKEEEQYEVYRQVAEQLAGKTVVIRTLDIGGDKQLDYMPLPHENNPVLGFRAIRVSLDRRDLFKTQLKAILRASVHGNVKIMYPMISSVEDIRHANEILEHAKQELVKEGKSFHPHIEIGIMIEIPAAITIADVLAKEVQFFSIGTNDLTQYILAVDRMNESIAHLYEPYHPAVIRSIKWAVDAAKREGIPINICGELAGDEKAVPLWLALGVDEISMSVQSMLPVKNRILHSKKAGSDFFMEQLLQCQTSEQIKQLLDDAAQHK